MGMVGMVGGGEEEREEMFIFFLSLSCLTGQIGEIETNGRFCSLSCLEVVTMVSVG